MRARPGRDALLAKGWWGAWKWLILRRATQTAVLALFLAGPWAGWWVVKGNLSSSLTLDLLPLTDPFVLSQTLATGNLPAYTALLGAGIVLVFYFLVGGRVYCSWVCPVNVVTDTAHWLRRRLGIGPGARFRRDTRYGILAAVLAAAALSGVAAWELVNPVSLVFRGLVFGWGLAWIVVAAVFVFDLLVSRHGWCGHLCPMGAFYSLVGAGSPLRISARNRRRCNDCMDCYAVCPEPQVIAPVLKGAERGVGPVILAPQCNNCGRCIDVCSKDVFRFSTRFDNAMEATT